MSELVIDARKALDSGIGTYIRNVVPRVVRLISDRRLIILLHGRSAQAQRDALNIDDAPNLLWMSTDAEPFGVAEQIELRQILVKGRRFWATSLAHPLFWNGTLIATTHDLAQLVLPDSLLLRRVAREYFRSVRSRASLLMCVSEFTRAEFQRILGIRSKTEVVVTPLGVDESWFTSPAIHRRQSILSRYFVVVGNLKPHKNIRRVLQAYSRVMSEIPQDLIIIGQHEGFRTTDSGLVEAIGAVGPRAHFMGSIDDDELKSIIGSADALVFASLYEGFGLPVLEAAAAGCLVLTSRTGATNEICGESGMFIEPESVDSIMEGLRAVARMSSGERQIRVQTARMRAKSFSWDRTAELTAEAIACAMRSRDGAAERR